jgi:hypothetical protein
VLSSASSASRRNLEVDRIRRSDASRAVGITDAGRLGLQEILGIRVSA